MTLNASIFGPEGPEITSFERDFFRDTQPFGFILFARNIVEPTQLRRLTAELREAVGRDAPILVDQEGGRVQRMRSPYWREFLPALDQMTRARDPMRAHWIRNRLIADDLRSVGIDVNCAPLADIAEAQTHPFLYNRLYGQDVATVVAAARVCADALLSGGVLPVLKHIPGHGRANVDSHLGLPRVEAPIASLHEKDFAPFRALSDLPMGMSAHIVFDAIDPTGPATTSEKMINVIRKDIGFDGLLMTDDLSMEALSGTVAERAAASIQAGCDLALHCNGKAPEMQAVAEAAGLMTEAAQKRANSALSARRPPENVDIAALEAELEALLA
ncbi:glycoside hydrolase family 3 N-terminal domain-containing protein [Loktanella sp. S4079]|uniref:glycoside hydrolase family 3 N-terminal domain-containing protein n=1 Tax=Loktanella sp. S4079 TaxID=579483 RepID=UPI0005F9D94A|nr:glycoside hydrolase family 3 N-terminal domain-containing protein [Loktanella sp. S4079]KJZ20277.1 beta-hexosaminidase [Loktanella sp. S4079]